MSDSGSAPPATPGPAPDAPADRASPAAPRGHGTLVRHSAGFALSLYVARAAMLARGWAAAAALGPQGFGIWNTVNLILDYGAYASLGAVQGLDLELPAARQDPPRARALMAGAWSVTLGGGALFALAVAAVVGLVPRTADTPAPGLSLLMLAAALLQLAFLYYAASLRAFGRVPAVSAAQAAQAAAGAGLGLVLVWSWGLWGLAAGWIAGTLLALAMMMRAGPDVPLVPAALAAGLRVARAGAPVFGFYLASLALRSLDRLALVRHAPASELGLYGLGVMAAGTLLHLPESAAFVLFPRMAAAHRGAEDPERTRASVVRVQRFVTVLMPAVVGVAVLWVAPVVSWLLPAYAGGATAIATLCLAALVLSTATVPSYYLLASGGAGRLVALGAAAAVLQAVVVFAAAAAAPRAFAVARAALAGYAAFAIPVLVVAARRLAPRGATRFVAASVAPALWATVLAMTAIHVMPGQGAGRAALATLAFAAGYAPVVWLARPRPAR